MMTLLTTYPTIEEASIVKGMLSSYGIEAVLGDNAISDIFPAPNSGTGQVALYVEKSQADRALELLREHGD